MNVRKIFAERPVVQGRRVDVLLIASIILLWGLGLLTLFTGSAYYAQRIFDDSNYFINRQLIMSLIGLVALLLSLVMNLSYLRRLLPWIMGGALVLCLLTFVPGISSPRNGAHRWIVLPFFGETFQPSETVKIALPLFLANWFDKFMKSRDDVSRSLFPPVVVICLFSGVVMVQDDFSTSLLIFVVGFLMMYVAGARLGRLVPFMLLAVGAMVIFVFSSPFRVNRIIAFVNPDFDTHGYNYQTAAARMAVSAGGWLGQGLGTGMEKINRVPEIQTDYVFSSWAESMGFVGVLAYFCVLGLFAWRGYKMMVECRTKFTALTCFGLTTSIVLQSLLNCGVVCGALPVTGVTLPFFSSGGSSLLITCCMCGLLLNISYRNSGEESVEE